MSESDLISSISTDQLLSRLDSDERLYLVDVREPDEVADWQIPGAHNVPLQSLAANIDALPKDADLVMVCAKGSRAQQGRVSLYL